MSIIPNTLPRPSEPLRPEDLRLVVYGGGKRELIDGVLVISSDAAMFTLADRDMLPEDGRRHELIFGALVVSPAPSHLHQRVAMALALRLSQVIPPTLEVLSAPFDVPGPDSALQPDVLVVSRVRAGEPVGVPVLAIEVLSPSTARFDRGLRRDAYAEIGIASYWIVDPDEPSITVYALTQDEYVEVQRATGAERISLTEPVRLDLVPAALLD